MIPIVAAAKLGISLVDCNGIGRALPELPMVTFHLNGMSVTPIMTTDKKGSIGIMETADNTWIERLTRIQMVEISISALVGIYPTIGRQLQDYGVHDIVTLSEEIGKVIRGTYANEQGRHQTLIEVTDSSESFQGRILDVEREVKGGFNLGCVKLSGLNSDTGSKAVVHLQNEDLVTEKDGQVIAMMPDLICMVDSETLTPVTTESLKYSKRVQVADSKADAVWWTKRGIETVGPRYLGRGVDYQPLENLVMEEDR